MDIIFAAHIKVSEFMKAGMPKERRKKKMEESKEERRWTELVDEYTPSAREYFYILRLALFHVKKIKTDSSYEVCQELAKQEDGAKEVYACATEILKTLYGEK